MVPPNESQCSVKVLGNITKHFSTDALTTYRDNKKLQMHGHPCKVSLNSFNMIYNAQLNMPYNLDFAN